MDGINSNFQFIFENEVFSGKITKKSLGLLNNYILSSIVQEYINVFENCNEKYSFNEVIKEKKINDAQNKMLIDNGDYYVNIDCIKNYESQLFIMFNLINSVIISIKSSLINVEKEVVHKLDDAVFNNIKFLFPNVNYEKIINKLNIDNVVGDDNIYNIKKLIVLSIYFEMDKNIVIDCMSNNLNTLLIHKVKDLSYASVNKLKEYVNNCISNDSANNQIISKIINGFGASVVLENESDNTNEIYNDENKNEGENKNESEDILVSSDKKNEDNKYYYIYIALFVIILLTIVIMAIVIIISSH